MCALAVARGDAARYHESDEAPMGTRPFRAAAAAALFAHSLVTTTAGAGDRLRMSVDWGKLADVLRIGAGLLPPGTWHGSRENGNAVTSRRWFGASPRLSLVARDWGGPQLLVGELTLSDLVRLSRSSRMVLGRMRISGGRLAPFVQAALGQWRIDTAVMPFTPIDVELAGQVGGGFELALGPNAAVALEGDYTILYREQHEPQMVSPPQLWGTFFAARMVF
jgi:hypothetical protein